MAYTKKRREECIIFLDEGFSAESVAAGLRSNGFTVERFPDWFKDSSGQTRRNVLDPEVIKFCHKHGWMLVTRDHEMKNLYREEIRKTAIAILATAHNSAANQNDWVEAIIKLKPQLLREFTKRERPWFATFSREGRITTIQTIS